MIKPRPVELHIPKETIEAVKKLEREFAIEKFQRECRNNKDAVLDVVEDIMLPSLNMAIKAINRLRGKT
jgi:hypothetical protein